MASTHVGSGPVSLRQVLPKARFTRGSDLAVGKHTSDWRDCAPGDLYVALTTADGDGHEHAREAISRGAIAVLAERLVPVDAPVVLVKDTRTALGRLTQAPNLAHGRLDALKEGPVGLDTGVDEPRRGVAACRADSGLD